MDFRSDSLPKILLLCVAIGLVAGGVAGLAASSYVNGLAAQHERMNEFYAVENAVYVSPTEYTRAWSAGKSIATLVDLRSAGAYEAGHLAGAVNVPVDVLTDAQIIEAFLALPQEEPIITYCYSSYCMLSRKVGLFLAENGIYVKHLTVGGKEIMEDYEPFVVKGNHPGEMPAQPLTTDCPINSVSGFGC